MDSADFTRKIRTALAPRSLGAWPTPLERAAPELWIKREDRSASVAGGNQVRGLEFLLARLPAGAAVVTVGGWGSTHCLATALHARALGYRVALAQFIAASERRPELVAGLVRLLRRSPEEPVRSIEIPDMSTAGIVIEPIWEETRR